MKKIGKKIHLILGILSCLPLAIIGITGAMLSYEKQLMELINPSIFNLKYQGKTPMDKRVLLEKLTQDHGVKILAIRLHSGPNKPLILITPPAEGSNSHRKVLLHVNPYTGEFLGPLQGRALFLYARYLHKDLMLGAVGKHLVALSTIALILLSLSGLYLFWKPLTHNPRSALSLNRHARGKKLYYNLHTALGTTASVAFLVMGLSGLFWSYEWYKKGVYTLANVEMPAPRAVAAREEDEESAPPRARTFHAINTEQAVVALELFNEAAPQGFHELSIRKIRNSDEFKIGYLDAHYPHSKAHNTLHVNPIQKTITLHETYAEQKIGEKFINSMLPIHSGEFFGTFFQVAFLLACLFLPLFGVTGVLLYTQTKRRKP